MISAIPNQPINFAGSLIEGHCADEDPIKLIMHPEDSVIFQILSGRCSNATEYVDQPEFRSGWTTSGNWLFSSTLDGTEIYCAENEQSGGYIEFDDFTPTVGELYELEFVVHSIEGSGIDVSVGGFEATVILPGTYTYIFSASTEDLLRITLVDDSSAVCLESAQVYAGNNSIEVNFLDADGAEIESLSMGANPDYFTISGQHITVTIPLEDVGFTSETCFSIQVTETCYVDEETTLCSQPITFDGCGTTLKVRACIDADNMGFVAGYFEARVIASLHRPQWEYDTEEERWSNGFINRHYIDRQRVMDFDIQPVDGDLHPFLSALPMFDHVYIGNNEYSIDPEEYSPEYASQSATGAVKFTVRPKQELLRKVMCEPVGAGCDPDNDPICVDPQVSMEHRLQDGQHYINVVVYSELGFIPSQIDWTMDGVSQTPVTYNGPGSYEVGPIPADTAVTVTLVNSTWEECNYIESFDIPLACGGAPLITSGPTVQCGEDTYNVTFTVESSSDFTIYPDTDPNATLVQIQVDGGEWLTDSNIGTDGTAITADVSFGQTIEIRLMDTITGCIYLIPGGPFDDTPCTG